MLLDICENSSVLNVVYVVKIITLVICTFFDEMIIMPMKKHYSTKYLINKEIDSRE